MNGILESLLQALTGAVLISGLVVIMMMLIESLNLSVQGKFYKHLQGHRLWQIVLSALLGSIPGCMGGFASVSLYTHGMIGFGALVAMMIASSGDEAFVLLAISPEKALLVFAILLVIAVVCGWLIDLFYKNHQPHLHCDSDLQLADSNDVPLFGHTGHRTWFWQRTLLAVSVVVFLVALLSGLLEPDSHEHEMGRTLSSDFLLSETWMYWLFGAFALMLLVVILFGSDDFVRHQLWHHVVVRHCPSTFAWTFGVLAVLNVAFLYIDFAPWISDNIPLMIVLASLIGMIPESGPHLLFVTLFAQGIVPLPVLLASCISQDGHASLPLLAESKLDFLRAKLVNLAVALVAGYAAMLFV